MEILKSKRKGMKKGRRKIDMNKVKDDVDAIAKTLAECTDFDDVFVPGNLSDSNLATISALGHLMQQNGRAFDNMVKNNPKCEMLGETFIRKANETHKKYLAEMNLWTKTFSEKNAKERSIGSWISYVLNNIKVSDEEDLHWIAFHLGYHAALYENPVEQQ